MNFTRRLRRHLSYANVIASIALFAALGGGAYAASTINGSKIKNQSIAGKKLKNGTVTNKQIKAGTITSKEIAAGSLNSTVIDVSTLGTVPSAQTAVTATSAETANKANTATTATSANTAQTAASAEVADEANSADSATDAGHASEADNALEADHAATADDAETVGGHSAEELTVSCPEETELYGGMCWDEDVRTARNWIQASKDCGDEGGRLPSLSELIAFISRPGIQAAAHNWSSDAADLETGVEVIFTSDEVGRAKALASASFGYRCLFYRSN